MRFHPALLWLFWVTGIIGLMLIFRHFLRWMTALAGRPLQSGQPASAPTTVKQNGYGKHGCVGRRPAGRPIPAHVEAQNGRRRTSILFHFLS